MKKGEANEIRIFEEVKLLFPDANVTKCDTADSTVPDIFIQSDEDEFYIECKTFEGSACGQFVTPRGWIEESIIDDPFDATLWEQWVYNHYFIEKNVRYIATMINNECTLMNWDEFINKFKITLQVRAKLSGSSSITKKNWEVLTKTFPANSFIKIGKKFYTDLSISKAGYFIGEEHFNVTGRDSEGDFNRITQSSKTKNLTYIFYMSPN
jgi:hypothetical protein